MKSGKSYVRLLTKNMKWNESGIPAAGRGLMSISTGEAEKLFAAYTKKDCVGFMITFGTDERVKFEEIRDTISESVCRQKKTKPEIIISGGLNFV